MKKVFKFVLLLILQLLCVSAFAGCTNQNVIVRLKDLYGVDTQLLNDYEIVYDIKGETFTGRAPHYAVITFKEQPTQFIESFTNTKDGSGGFSYEQNSELKNLVDTHSCLEIADEYYPDWDSEYIWLNQDELYLIYFPNEFKLVVYESGH